MNKTANYNLNQWEPDDPVRRTDFNEDNARLDAALAGKADALDLAKKADASALAALQTVVNGKGNCVVEYGTYVGTGIVGETADKAVVLRLGYRPKLVFISGADCTGLFLFPNTISLNVRLGDGINLQSEWLEDGLRWWASNASGKSAYAQFNTEGQTYYYVAFH